MHVILYVIFGITCLFGTGYASMTSEERAALPGVVLLSLVTALLMPPSSPSSWRRFGNTVRFQTG
jgi:hypothetical protein